MNFNRHERRGDGTCTESGANLRENEAVLKAETPSMVSEIIREHAASGEGLRIAGKGTWLDAGRPTHTVHTLSTLALSGLHEYVPGDLVMTVGAGTTLREIREAALPHRQWLALDPFGSEDGTIGATIATASDGPLAASWGRARDLVLGIDAVDGNGREIRAGGKVVKNVAGFDLVRLFTGSWGTLGVLTAVSIRLHALPQNETTVAIDIEPELMAAVLQAVQLLPFSPMAAWFADAVSARFAEEASGEAPMRGAAVEPAHEFAGTLYLRLGGNPERLREELSHVRKFGTIREVDPAIWRRLASIENDSEYAHWSVLRASSGLARMSQVLSVVAAPRPVAEDQLPPPRFGGAVGSGVVRIVVQPDATAQLVSALRGAGIGTVAERMPPSLWHLFPPPADSLSRRIRDSFDPDCILNSGMMGLHDPSHR